MSASEAHACIHEHSQAREGTHMLENTPLVGNELVMADGRVELVFGRTLKRDTRQSAAFRRLRGTQ